MAGGLVVVSSFEDHRNHCSGKNGSCGLGYLFAEQNIVLPLERLLDSLAENGLDEWVGCLAGAKSLKREFERILDALILAA